MKLRSIILPLLAVGSIAAAQIGSANAYFTTYVTAKGFNGVSWEHSEEIDENFHDWTKYVTISSKENSIPVFVRAKALAGDDHPLTISGTNWEKGDDDYWYYMIPLEGGGTTKELAVSIGGIPDEVETQEEDNFNVVVVYECIPATYHEDGDTTDDPRTANWNGALSSTQTY